MISIHEVMAFLQKYAPLALAESWDNVGLLLGDPSASIERAITCLTITPEVVQEAVAGKVGLIVSHHPILFKPIQRLTADSVEGMMVWTLAHAGIAVYSPHTAFDNCTGGINDQLAQWLGLTNVRPLAAQAECGKVKIVVFVPEGDLQKVSDALFAVGAGIIGEYRECSFRLPGTGTFHGMPGAQPTVGQKGRREEVGEYRLEMVCPANRLAEALTALRGAHSYEEPAFDVYPLQALPGKQGAGRLGELPVPLPAQAWAQQTARQLGLASVTLTGATARQVRTVAIVCGAGGSMLGQAVQAGADGLVTGELRFHDELATAAANLAVVVAGHYATERPGVEALSQILAAAFSGLTIWPSKSERNPSQVIIAS